MLAYRFNPSELTCSPERTVPCKLTASHLACLPLFSAWEISLAVMWLCSGGLEKPRNAGDYTSSVSSQPLRRKSTHFFFIRTYLLHNPWEAPRDTEPLPLTPTLYSTAVMWSVTRLCWPSSHSSLTFLPYLCFLGSAPNLGGIHTKTVDHHHHHHHHQFWFSLSQAKLL